MHFNFFFNYYSDVDEELKIDYQKQTNLDNAREKRRVSQEDDEDFVQESKSFDRGNSTANCMADIDADVENIANLVQGSNFILFWFLRHKIL